MTWLVPGPLFRMNFRRPLPCMDCGADTGPAGLDEYYAVHTELWAAAVGDPEAGYLCIGCLEARIGRTLTPEDFRDAPINGPDFWHSPRLESRLGLRSGE